VRMNQRSQDVITEALGVQPVPINSSLVSAQNRKRLYWTNIPFKYPLDKEIMMKDILQDPSEISPEHYHSMKAVEYMEKGNDKWGQAGSRRADGYEQTPETQKSFTLTANMHKGVPYNYFKDTRSGLIKAGEADLKGHGYNRRVYHPDGKAPTLCASSGGNLEPKILQTPRGWNTGGLKAKDGKTPSMTSSSWQYNNHLTYDEGLTWRKLTPIECERLQTVPDNYTAHVSNTQRYKMLGNGFTVDVISEILQGILPPA